MKIGFIGLGNMGAPMAHNLARAGHEVIGFDSQPRSVPLVTTAASLADAVTTADTVITMLPDGNIVQAVAATIIPAMTAGTSFIDCSTIDVQTARKVATDARNAGLMPLDAPVSGGTLGATGATLTFMVGGQIEAFENAAPLFDIMGSKSVHCGESGTGQVAKICNNMIAGATMIATCETIVLADKLGLDRQKLFDVVSTSSGNSWTISSYCPAPGIGPKSPSDNDFRPGFACELMLKDLRLSQQAAEQVAADTPMGALACQLYQQYVENEDGRGRDFSAMLRRFEGRHRDDAETPHPE